MDRCLQVLENKVASIRKLNCCLPLSLNGSEGSVAAITVDSVKLVLKWGLEHMKQNLDPLDYLLSCMILDVENLHSVVHHKNQVSTPWVKLWKHSERGSQTHNIVVALLLHKPWVMVPSSGENTGPF